MERLLVTETQEQERRNTAADREPQLLMELLLALETIDNLEYRIHYLTKEAGRRSPRRPAC